MTIGSQITIGHHKYHKYKNPLERNPIIDPTKPGMFKIGI